MSVNNEQNFRDTISTLTKEGERAWVFPKIPSGKYYDRRKLLSYFLLIFMFSAPFIKINHHQFIMFNVLERRFNLFGFSFWPQDLHIFVILMIIGVVGLALFTVAFGRIFCGWFCPQTIFMEMVFRRIEFWIDGDRGAQIRLDKQEWDGEKIRKRLLKWTIFFIISFIIANVFLAFLISSDKLYLLIQQGPLANSGTFTALIIFTGVFYFIYAWFREQVCIIVCPYGRMQGVLLDNKSITVAYDHVRGERELGRTKFVKNEDRAASGKGDCINDGLCVHVCPTGIDIRNGIQLECVNCTACIDACDHIMESVGLPKGLIRYASEEEIVSKSPFVFTARMKGYAAVMVILLGIFVGMLFLRNDVEATVLRLPGQLFQHKGQNISNIYTFKIINKTSLDFNKVHIELVKVNGTVTIVGKKYFKVPKDGIAEGTLFIEIPEHLLEEEKTKVVLNVLNDNQLIDAETTIFLGPRSFE